MQAILMTLVSAALLLAAANSRADDTLTMPVPYGAVASLPIPTADDESAYGQNPLQTVLRFDPEGQARAELLFIHGGCWSADYSRDHTLPLAGALRDAGFRVWIPEYRRVGDQGGGWPGTWEDVQQVGAYVAAQASAPLVVAGHSAGGHLALLMATSSQLPIAGAIGLAPITDLVAYGAGDSSCQTMTPKLIGAPLAAAEETYREASPAFLALTAPVVVLQGEADPIVPMSQATAMQTAQRVIIPEAGHFDLIHPGTAAFPLLLDAIEGLLP